MMQFNGLPETSDESRSYQALPEVDKAEVGDVRGNRNNHTKQKGGRLLWVLLWRNLRRK